MNFKKSGYLLALFLTVFAVILEYAVARIIAALLTSQEELFKFIFLLIAAAFVLFICDFIAKNCKQKTQYMHPKI